MELEIVSKETIQPSSPTPPELRILPLCLFDQQAPNVYIEILYFYDANDADSGHGRRLKDSLSKALTFYYPFAGRLGDGAHVVDCNDMGVTFSEAKLPCPMSEFMNAFNSQCRPEILKLICLDDMIGKDQRLNPLLCIQLTQFECGGEVMFVVCSHKVADMASLTSFMNDWATIARTSRDADPPVVSRPRFNTVGFFPAESDGGSEPPAGEGNSGTKKREEDICSKRFVFEGSKIAALKALVSEHIENPSRVQILTALIYKAALSAKNSVTGGSLAATSVLQLINLRTRVEPALEKTFIGNIVTFFVAASISTTTTTTTTSSSSSSGSSGDDDDEQMEVCKLVGDMKRNFEDYCNSLPKDYKSQEWGSLYRLHSKRQSLDKFRNPAGDCILYVCTSWCNFPIYDADFGWGKPVWITPPAFPPRNLIVLMDTKDGHGGGVEAIVCLDTNEMAAFQQNQHILSFSHLRTFP